MPLTEEDTLASPPVGGMALDPLEPLLGPSFKLSWCPLLESSFFSETETENRCSNECQKHKRMLQIFVFISKTSFSHKAEPGSIG
jgi:hypothetical protein